MKQLLTFPPFEEDKVDLIISSPAKRPLLAAPHQWLRLDFPCEHINDFLRPIFITGARRLCTFVKTQRPERIGLSGFLHCKTKAVFRKLMEQLLAFPLFEEDKRALTSCTSPMTQTWFSLWTHKLDNGRLKKCIVVKLDLQRFCLHSVTKQYRADILEKHVMLYAGFVPVEHIWDQLKDV